MMELEEARNGIGEIDLEILRLMEKRLGLARIVGEDKVARNAPVRNMAQEKNVIDRYRGFALEHGMNPVYAEHVCRILMQESIEVQASLPRSSAEMRHISIVGGNGKMGRWFADLLRQSGHRVDIIDPSSGNGLTLDDAKWSDTVIVSVPISRTRGILEKLDEICPKDTLIFDIASLKSPFADTLREMGKHRMACSVHPMFGPSAESMYDRNLLVCDCGSEDAVKSVISLLGNHGANIRTMPIEKHDMYMSYVLGLSHAVNIAFFTVLERSGIDFEDMRSVASTTYNKLMDTNESVALEDPYLYYEIQHLNAYREEMLGEFDRAVHDVVEAALADNPEAFKDLMDKGREYFT